LGVVVEECFGVDPMLESNESNESPVHDCSPVLILRSVMMNTSSGSCAHCSDCDEEKNRRDENSGFENGAVLVRFVRRVGGIVATEEVHRNEE
jgi:hypothetical protein